MAKAVTFKHVLERIVVRIRTSSAEAAEIIFLKVVKSRHDWTLERVESDDGFLVELQKELKNIADDFKRK